MEADLQQPPPIDNNQVHVWTLDLQLPPDQLAVSHNLLNTTERERAARFHFDRDRNHFIAARGQLRTVLGRYTGVLPARIAFTYGDHGKPYLAGNLDSLQFNLSHSHHLALLAVTRHHEIGVDIEYLDREVSVSEIAKRFFSQRESGQLLSLHPTAQRPAFFRCWTRKEAFLKAKGMGITFGLDQFSVSLHPEEKAQLLETPYDPEEAAQWTLVHLEPAPGYVGAIAATESVTRVETWRFDWK
jgi:4'-phosphopantetheinyl transferase